MEELRRGFHEQLEELNAELLRMGSVVVETIERTRLAFLSLDSEVCRSIINDDDIVDDYRDRVEEAGFELIARQAPVASDLRRLIVIMRMAQHFERMADLCVNICKSSMTLEAGHISDWIRESINEMAIKSRNLVELAVTCYQTQDLLIADELDVEDEAIDQVNRRFFKEFKRTGEEDIETAVRVVMISRFFERIGDNAVDVGEHVRFMMTGQGTL
ncbi:MAG: phosphate signaling complex protein PhoU [Candidatus Geothermincolia bacterium]